MRRVFLVLFGLSAALLLYCGAVAFKPVWNHYRFSVQVPLVKPEWSVVPVKGSRYAAGVEFSYRLEGKEYRKFLTLSQPLYLNEISAKNNLTQYEKLSWSAWIDPGYPAEPSLQKFFPFKQVLHFVLTFAITVYFLVLSFPYSSRSFSD